jgi:hypothetical protein
MSEIVDKTILVKALTQIARGRTDNGRPLGGPKAQDVARTALTNVNLDWSHAAGQRSPQESGHE